MKSLYFLFILLFVHLQLYSQDFRPGYIILKKGGIENGLIKYGYKKDNFSRCVFKSGPDTEKREYLPDEIVGYKFNDGKYYVSQKQDSVSENKVFMEYIFDGIVDLYYYFDSRGDHYYIQKNNSGLKELKNDIRKIVSKTPAAAGISEYYTEINPVQYEKESKEYIGLLKIYFQDQPEIMKKTDYVSFNINSLIDISEDYHNAVCPGIECINYVKKKTKIVLKVSPAIGLLNSNISFARNTPTYKFDDKYTASKGFIFGVLLNISDSHISENISIQLEPSFSNNNYRSSNSVIKLSTVKIPLIFRCSLPYKSIQPFFDLGLVYNRFLKFESNSIYYNKIDLIHGNNQIGLAAGIGTNINNKKHGISILARYEYLVGQHTEILWDEVPGNVNVLSKNISLLLSYRF